MPGQILINYGEVYSKVAELRNRINIELRELDTKYRQVQSSLRRMDGKTNTVFSEAMEDNQRKARLASETLQELLAFIEISAREVERNEQMHQRIFEFSRLR